MLDRRLQPWVWRVRAESLSGWPSWILLLISGGLAALAVVLVVLSFVIDRVLEHRARWGEFDWESVREVQLLQEYTRIETLADKGVAELNDLVDDIGPDLRR